MTTDRRSFLRAAATASAAAGLLPTTVARALAIPARHRTGTIMDVEQLGGTIIEQLAGLFEGEG